MSDMLSRVAGAPITWGAECLRWVGLPDGSGPGDVGNAGSGLERHRTGTRWLSCPATRRS